ncbi:MAG: HAMP domain-containing protein, partial [Dehalococcoidia bacterium]|nr:HAMP domain-containing protein [Dehalococcoidia bacterium]
MGTIRFRLTLWYAALFLAAGIALLALVYVLVDRAFPEADPTFIERVANRPAVSDSRDALENLGVIPPRRNAPPPRNQDQQQQQAEQRVQAILDFVEQGRVQAREEALSTLLVQSSVALAAMAVLSVGAGWWVAGRMLRPVADITGTVRRISGERLSDHRVALEGPRDELKELADQFDAML